MGNYNPESEFSPKQLAWFKQLDKYKEARTKEIYWEFMRGEHGNQNVMDLVEELADVETQIVNWIHIAENRVSFEEFKWTAISEMYGETNMASEAYEKYIKPWMHKE